jgi:hypothetical protein
VPYVNFGLAHRTVNHETIVYVTFFDEMNVRVVYLKTCFAVRVVAGDVGIPMEMALLKDFHGFTPLHSLFDSHPGKPEMYVYSPHLEHRK